MIEIGETAWSMGQWEIHRLRNVIASMLLAGRALDADSPIVAELERINEEFESDRLTALRDLGTHGHEVAEPVRREHWVKRPGDGGAVRKQRVERLRQAVQAGQYSVDSGTLAHDILEIDQPGAMR